MRDLEGKLALVTGGAKGVGRVVVQRLAERGAHVLINYFHSHDAARRAKEELSASGFQVDTIRASVAQKQQVERMFQEIDDRFGYLDILVNNAASGALVANDAVSEEHFSRALDTNLKGSFWCARLAAPLIARRGGGAIVNISSIGAGFVPANYLVVGTSKAALEALTRYLAVEYAPQQIRVNTASATLVEGDVARLFPRWEAMWQASIDHTPMGRLATADDLAGVVMFLTSEDSRWVTGQVVLADGGLSLASVALSPGREATAPARLPAVLADEPAASPGEQATAAVPGPDDASEDIAIVGMGLVVPGANNPEEYWRVLVDGPNLFQQVPADRWDYRSFYSPDRNAEDKSYQSRSVFITDFKPEPALRDEMAAAGTQHECTTLWLRHSLMQAMTGVRRRPGDRFSFAVGYTADGSQHLEEAAVVSGAVDVFERVLAGMSADDNAKQELLAGVTRALEQRYWRGTGSVADYLPHNVGRNAMTGVLPEDTDVLMVDTACSSSLYAADHGIKGLLIGSQDIAVCGGSFAVGPRGSVLFAKLHGLSESGEVRPLDKNCDGVLFSDGAGVVVLKKLARARADGDRILAVIKTCGASSDGKGKAIYAPSSSGQCVAVRRALAHPSVDLSRPRLGGRSRDRHTGGRSRRVHDPARDDSHRSSGVCHLEQVVDRAHRLGGRRCFVDRGGAWPAEPDHPTPAPLQRAARRLPNRGEHAPHSDGGGRVAGAARAGADSRHLRVRLRRDERAPRRLRVRAGGQACRGAAAPVQRKDSDRRLGSALSRVPVERRCGHMAARRRQTPGSFVW